MSDQKGPDLFERFFRLIGLPPSQFKAAKTITVLVLLAAGVLLLDNLNFGSAGNKPPRGPSTVVSGSGVVATVEGPPTTAGAASSATAMPLSDDLTRYQAAIAAKLQTILSQMAGAGAVDVTVTLKNGPEMVVHENTKTTSQETETTDAGGGKSKTTQTDTTNDVTVLRNGNSADTPLVIKEQAPEVSGVLVVADGARSYSVQLELTRAVSVALGVSPSRIKVEPRGGH